VSNDRGETWRTISPDLAAPPGFTVPAAAAGAGGVGAPAAGGSITTLAPSPVTAGVIWVGTSTGLIHVTRDNGKTWSNVTPPNLPPAGINVIDASHASAGTAYAALLSRDAHPHIYRTSDYGAKWEEVSSGLTDGEVVRVVREDPKDPSLLYAGTVTGVYVSFDRGNGWQSLQLNLPTTVVSDLTVHDNDVVISTYGRGFWILDDMAPLRQVRAMASGGGPAVFFTPSPASRMRWDNTQDTPVPPEMVVGENPPEGAILYYYLPSAASGPITLTISDASGAVVREYSSVAPAADTTMANVPDYWLAPLPVLPTTAGMHRVAWDLRYSDPPTLNYGYSGTALDYREYTLSWHAIPGKTPRSTLVGPMVLPGTYTAKLTVNGRSYAQPIAVAQDARITVPPAALAAQFRLQQRMVAGLGATYRAVTYLHDVRAALTPKAREAIAASPDAARALQAVDAALAQMETGPDGFGIAHRDLGRRLNDQLVADMAPTPSVVAGVDGPCVAIDRSSAALAQLQSAQFAPINSALSRASLPTLPAWTPPAAPACGAR